MCKKKKKIIRWSCPFILGTPPTCHSFSKATERQTSGRDSFFLLLRFITPTVRACDVCVSHASLKPLAQGHAPRRLQKSALLEDRRWRVRVIYLSVNLALLLEEDVRLRGQRQDVPYHGDGRWTGRKARGTSLFDELTDQQEGEECDSQAEHAEQSLCAGHRHQRRRFNWNHLLSFFPPHHKKFLKKRNPSSLC